MSIRAWRELETLRRSAAVDNVATNRVLEAYDNTDSTLGVKAEKNNDSYKELTKKYFPAGSLFTCVKFVSK